ncbi:MAG TPA: hypothetical protein VJ044_03040 [Candidatus Hodarchaeales archaeon]|nr:hypothetical protein [Candidatus Hodarchaeales archaeon]
MAKYTLTAIVDEVHIGNVETKIRLAFGDEKIISIQKIKHSESRADRLAEAESDVDNAKNTVESLKEELRSWFDNLSENFRLGEKASQLEEAISTLESIVDALDQCDWGVEFPGMY